MKYGPFGDLAPLTFTVSAAIVIALALVLAGHPGPLFFDQAAIDMVDSIRSPWLTDRMTALTDFGSGYVVWVVALFAVLGLAANQRWPELAVALTGALVLLIGIPELKLAVERPRPAGALFLESGFSYPSGHAAQSTWYFFLAVLIVHLAPPETKRRGLILAIGALLCLGIGLSRVYLEVHYLSDVIGGWALGAAAFTLWAVFERARGRLRHNLSSDLPGGQ